LAEVVDWVVFGSDWPGPGVPGIRANAEAFWALPYPSPFAARFYTKTTGDCGREAWDHGAT